MRARTIREGSVGLLILLGIGLFGGLVLWLRGFNPANRPYELIAEFEDIMGVQVGTPVMYRGVSVGRVMSITPKSNSVDVGLEITAKELRMPNQVVVETVESGLIGEMSIEITPQTDLSASASDVTPIGKSCDSALILCDGDRLEGEMGPSYEELLRSTSNLTKVYADPELLQNIKDLLVSISETSAEAGLLTKEATLLTQQTRSEIQPLSGSAQNAADSAALAAAQIAATAQEFSLTATEISGLIGENRGALVDTLGNVQAASVQLRTVTDSLGPTFQSGELVGNLEVVLSNAAAASEDLQALTNSLNTPVNLVLLQQTLESARDALSSAQKVMADVDEITGDPAVREQIRNLINGLGGLVSSTQSLEEHSEVARTLAPLTAESAVATSETSVLVEELPAEEALTEEALTEEESTPQRISERPNTATQRPVLVFDGERYVLRSAEQLAAERPGSVDTVDAASNLKRRSEYSPSKSGAR